MTVRRLPALLLLLLTWAALTGAFGPCQLFKPATPEAPSGKTLIGNYLVPDSTLSSIVYAVRAKGLNGGADVYRSAFGDSGTNGLPDGRMFRAFFDPATVARYANPSVVPSSWTHPDEERFFQHFVGLYPSLSYDLIWTVNQPAGRDIIDENAGTALLHRKYVVTVRQSDGTVKTIGTGFADLDLVRPGSRWFLVKWQDREDPAAPVGADSYGKLRIDNQ